MFYIRKQEQEKEKQRQELICSRDSLKKMKAVLSSKQTAQDLYKREMNQVHEKLRLEEQAQKDLQKVRSKIPVLIQNTSSNPKLIKIKIDLDRKWKGLANS